MTNRARPVGLPIGMAVDLDVETQVRLDGSIAGGSPSRIFRLNPAAVTALAELQAGTVRTPAGAALGRRLSDAGLIHPAPARSRDARFAGSVTVVVPVRDRPTDLDRCLRALTADRSPSIAATIVVDDGSDRPAEVAEVANRHGVTLIVRTDNGGPAQARNTALEQIDTEFVAFCDSDCVPEPDWVDALLGHFDDSLVVAVAPRVGRADGSVGTGRLVERFARSRSPLDLGDRPARVMPMTRVAYLPTAALIVRRAALQKLPGRQSFDPQLRYGEDVDLIWRLIDAGGRVRYDPGAQVGHSEPLDWPTLLHRRFAYGTSAAQLETRHPGKVAPLVLVASPAAAVAGLLARRPLLTAVGAALGYIEIARSLSQAGLPVRNVGAPIGRGVKETFFGSGRWSSQFAGPVLVAVLAVRAGGRRTRWRRRVTVAALVIASPLREWLRVRPPLDPARWTIAVLADDAAYGAGVWVGSVRAGHFRAVFPQWRWRLIGARPAPWQDRAQPGGGRTVRQPGSGTYE